MASDVERAQKRVPESYEILATSAASVEDLPMPAVRSGASEFEFGQRSSDGREQCWDVALIDAPAPQAEAKKTGLSKLKLVLLSVVNVGTGFGWALQLSLLTPYIQMLGVEHEFSSFVWLCGPIAGLVVQPIVGLWTDRCTSRWGRRRPYIGSGVLMIMLSVTIIGFAADIGSNILGDSQEDCQVFKGKRPRAASVVILGFWLLDIAANTVDPPLRALLADLSGPGQRVAANSIYCWWGALGSVLGYSAGSYGQWHRVFPSLTTRACCAPCANLKAAFLLQIALLAICTTITLVVGNETPLMNLVVKEQQLAEPGGRDTGDDEESHNKPHEDDPLLMDEPSNGAQLHDSTTQIPINLHRQSNGHVPEQEEPDRDSGHGFVEELPSSSSRESNAGRSAARRCSLFVNLLLGVRKLPKSMTYVLAVMALSWFSWFPFFLFDTDWMGREVYEGDPNGNSTQVAAYQHGVEKGAFGLLVNSVVSGISSLLINPLCQMLGPKNVWAVANFILCIALICTELITRSVAGTIDHGRKAQHKLSKLAAVGLFAVLGFPWAITLSVPYSMTAELTIDSGTGGAGVGLAMGILNLAIVIPQTLVTLGAGPWDALFGGGNEPAFGLAALFGLGAAVLAVKKLPKTLGNPQRVVANEWAKLI